MEAAERAELTPKISIFPIKRSQKMFTTGNADALFPALRPTLPTDAYESEPFFFKDIHAVVLKNKEIPTDIEDLHGKTIGLVRGFSYPRIITVNENIKIDYANSQKTNLRKLANGRIDIIVADLKTVKPLLKNENLQGKIKFDSSEPFSRQPVFFAFQRNSKGKVLAEKFSKAIKSMKKDGTYDNILSELK